MQKSVQITVYVVKPRRTNEEQVSGNRRRPLRSSGGGGYDRKAQLLLYSQQLRTIASCCEFQTSDQKTHSLKKVKEVIQIVSSYKKSQEKVKDVLQIRTNQNSHQKVTETMLQIASSAKKVVPVELHKPVPAKLPQPRPSCFSDWRNILLPSFLARIFDSRNGKNGTNNKKKKLSVSLSEKMNAIMMSSRMEKERIGVMAKFLSLTGKRC